MSDIYRCVDDPEASRDDGAALGFIRAHLRPEPASACVPIRLYRAHGGSGLSRFAGGAPYWAWPWAGGLALARYIAEQPETVAQRRILDFGAGSGLVGIAAALAGAAHVVAVDRDPLARVAIAANAALNGVDVEVRPSTTHAANDIDLVLAGDVFYASGIGRRSLARLDRWRSGGTTVLIGDPYRPHLPQARLRCLATYRVLDVGGTRTTRSGVFALDALWDAPRLDYPAARSAVSGS